MTNILRCIENSKWKFCTPVISKMYKIWNHWFANPGFDYLTCSEKKYLKFMGSIFSIPEDQILKYKYWVEEHNQWNGSN